MSTDNVIAPVTGSAPEERVGITLDRAAWEQGFRDAEAGRRARPGTHDGLAYHSGFIEGQASASRERRQP